MIIHVDEKTWIIFDLDDTLFQEIDFLTSAFREIAVFVDSGKDKMIYNDMFAIYNSQGDAFNYIIQRFPEKKLTLEELLSIYRNHKPDISLNEGVIEIIKRIKNKKGKIGILTNGRSVTQRNKIDALGLTDYVDKIIISEEIGYEKPHELPYKFFMKKCKDCSFYYFGDNVEIDFISPKKLSWYCVGVKNIKNIHTKNADLCPDMFLPHEFINNFTEVIIQ